jgi:histidinol-phosphate phosphatase family protein
MALNQKPVVFLDKDGTLVDDVPYNVDPALVRLSPGADEAVSLLDRAGFRICVISNQSGVARGYFDEAALVSVEARVRELLDAAGARLSGFYYCPHAPADIAGVGCDCRKPADGLLRRAAADLGADLESSWMVGDILDDVEAGNRAGVHTILLANGNETQWSIGPGRFPEYIAADLLDAAWAILSASGRLAARSARPEVIGGR